MADKELRISWGTPRTVGVYDTGTGLLVGLLFTAASSPSATTTVDLAFFIPDTSVPTSPVAPTSPVVFHIEWAGRKLHQVDVNTHRATSYCSPSGAMTRINLGPWIPNPLALSIFT